MLIEKFRENNLFCPECHCPQEETFNITKTEGKYKCEICKKTFHYSYNKLNNQWSSYEEKKDKIICLVGESGSGKTTLCKELEKQGYNIIKSYTTRKQRNKDEYGHIFVNENNSTVEMFKWNTTINHEGKTVLCGYHPEIIAYTFFDNQHYWAERGQYQGKGSSIYVIDPAGVKYLKEKVDNAKILTIYIKCDKEIRLLRMLKEREPKSVKNRLINDKEAFRIIQCDYCVDGNREVDEVLKDIIHIIKEVDTNNE